MSLKFSITMVGQEHQVMVTGDSFSEAMDGVKKLEAIGFKPLFSGMGDKFNENALITFNPARTPSKDDIKAGLSCKHHGRNKVWEDRKEGGWYCGAKENGKWCGCKWGETGELVRRSHLDLPGQDTINF